MSRLLARRGFLVLALLSLLVSVAGCGIESGGAGGGNRPPQITKASPATPYDLAGGRMLSLYVKATDPDGDPLTYTWTTTDGNGSPTTSYGPPPKSWYSPSQGVGPWNLSVTVSDGQSTTTRTWAVTTQGSLGTYTGTWRSIWAVPEVTIEVTSEGHSQSGGVYYTGQILSSVFDGGFVEIDQIPPPDTTDGSIRVLSGGMFVNTGLFASSGPDSDPDRVVLEGARLESPDQLFLDYLEIYRDGTRIYGADTSFERQ